MKKHLLTGGKTIGFFVLWVAAVSISSLSVFDELSFLKGNAALLRLCYELLPLLFAFLLSVVFIRVIEKGEVKINTFVNPLKDCIMGIGLGCMWIGTVVLILLAIGTIHFESKNTVTYVDIWILAVLLNAIMQEYLIRGYLFQLLKGKYNALVAVVVTTILFTVMHGGAFEVGIVAVLNVITMSVFVSLLLIYTKNLIAPILVHFIWNMAGCIIFGGVSLAEDYPSIWNIAFIGNNLISGGSVKIEGSIVTLAINSLLITFIALLLAKGKGKNAPV